jgi:hypothetical protein
VQIGSGKIFHEVETTPLLFNMKIKKMWKKFHKLKICLGFHVKFFIQLNYLSNHESILFTKGARGQLPTISKSPHIRPIFTNILSNYCFGVIFCTFILINNTDQSQNMNRFSSQLISSWKYLVITDARCFFGGEWKLSKFLS